MVMAGFHVRRGGADRDRCHCPSTQCVRPPVQSPRFLRSILPAVAMIRQSHHGRHPKLTSVPRRRPIPSWQAPALAMAGHVSLGFRGPFHVLAAHQLFRREDRRPMWRHFGLAETIRANRPPSRQACFGKLQGEQRRKNQKTRTSSSLSVPLTHPMLRALAARLLGSRAAAVPHAVLESYAGRWAEATAPLWAALYAAAAMAAAAQRAAAVESKRR